MSDRRVLLTVSGRIPPTLDADVSAGRRPIADYTVLRDHLNADLVDTDIAAEQAGPIGRFLFRIGGAGLLLAWFCFTKRKNYDVVVTDGEQVGLPLALLTRVFGRSTLRHVMIVHIVSVPKKAKLIKWARLAGQVDRYLVYSSRQGEFIQTEVGVPHEHIVLTPFMVDTKFFEPAHVADTAARPMICSAGLERRDYDTLMLAVDGLDVDVVIAAASPWSKQADATTDRALPANVTVERFDLFGLRELYARSRFVVMPLHEVDFQAGITTILEAMAMGKCVLCSRTLGQTDTIIDDAPGVDDANGRYVEVGNADALRSAITDLLSDPATTNRLGARAREWVVSTADVERYADGVAEVVNSVRPNTTSD